MLRVALWHALLLVRGPVQFMLRILMYLHLFGAVAGVIIIFIGTGEPSIDDGPIIIRILAPVVLFGIYMAMSWISYLIDSLIFRVTPEDRQLYLLD